MLVSCLTLFNILQCRAPVCSEERCMLQSHNDTTAVSAALLAPNNVTINFHLYRELTLVTKVPTCGETQIMSCSFPLICICIAMWHQLALLPPLSDFIIQCQTPVSQMIIIYAILFLLKPHHLRIVQFYFRDNNTLSGQVWGAVQQGGGLLRPDGLAEHHPRGLRLDPVPIPGLRGDNNYRSWWPTSLPDNNSYLEYAPISVRRSVSE